MIIDQEILETLKIRPCYGPPRPTGTPGLDIRIDIGEAEELTIEVGPKDTDGIRRVRVTSDPCPERDSQASGAEA